ncbi:hypothetical protein KPL71_012662 [Citrus sinensis]|uniref:Uncharacterized protein n=1 Tax=Citrus sinensis TaxID=2711 RepID=A0ACB8LDN6_CITSI|nr:hypothetical protein KPL71_012662 [Citrus sinensis]
MDPRKVSDEDLSDVLDKAHSAIILSLGDGVLREVSGEITAAGLWKKLEDLYTKKSMAKRLATKKKLYTLQMEEGSSITDHIDAFNNIILDLEDINVKIDDEDKVMILLCLLPSSYEHLVDTLMYRRQTLTMVDVKETLSSKVTTKRESREAECLMARRRSEKKESNKGKKKISKSRSKNMKCFHCHKEGHFNKDCLEMKNKLKDIKEKIGDAAGASESQEYDGYDSTRVLIITDDQTIGMLDKMGCLVKLESGTLKVRGSMVLMKGSLSNGLYVLQGKSSRLKFSTGVYNSKGTLDYIHADLWGLAQTTSLDGARFVMSLIDDFSRMVWVYVLRNKDDAFEKFKIWKTLVETQTNKKVRRLRTDNGLEFCNKRFDDFCADNEVVRHKTVRHTPQQNGLAERMNRTLIDKVRCMLIQSRLPMSLWAETLSTACYIVNRSSSYGINFRTPIELWTGKPADYSNMRVFGCPAYAHTKQGKLEPRALKGVFIGYPEWVKGYKLWRTYFKPPKAIISRDVVFNEAEVCKYSEASKTKSNHHMSENHKSQFEVESSTPVAKQKTIVKLEYEAGRNMSESEAESKDDQGDMSYQLVRDMERRVIRPPKIYAHAYLIAFALTAAHELDSDEPKTYSEAIRGNES